MALFEISYHELVAQDDLPRIPQNIQERIRRAINNRLGSAPDRYGKRLSRSLQDLWRLRVGDYRVIYEITPRKVRVWMIANRKDAYRAIIKRVIK